MSRNLADNGLLIPLLLAAIVAGVGGYLGLRWWQVESQLQQTHTVDAVPLNGPHPTLADFTLTERSGETFHAADMRGRVWVVSYFFTACPGSCVKLNKAIQSLHDDPELEEVTWLSITCDPVNDSVAQLAAYADRMNADPNRWLFARGDLDYIKAVGRAMNLDIYEQSHKAYCLVIDRDGQLHGVYDLAGDPRDAERLKKRLVELLEQPTA